MKKAFFLAFAILAFMTYQANAEDCKAKITESEYGRFLHENDHFVNMDHIIMVKFGKKTRVTLVNHWDPNVVSECMSKKLKEALTTPLPDYEHSFNAGDMLCVDDNSNIVDCEDKK